VRGYRCRSDLTFLAGSEHVLHARGPIARSTPALVPTYAVPLTSSAIGNAMADSPAKAYQPQLPQGTLSLGMTCMKRSTTPPPPTPPHPSQDSKMVHTPLLVELKIAPSDTRTLSTWPSPWEASTSTGQGEDNDIVHVIGRHRRQAPRSLLKQRRLRQHTAMTTRRSKS
jgi:hypothetical protein